MSASPKPALAEHIRRKKHKKQKLSLRRCPFCLAAVYTNAGGKNALILKESCANARYRKIERRKLK